MPRIALISEDEDLHRRLESALGDEVTLDRLPGRMEALPFDLDRLRPSLVLFDLRTEFEMSVRQAVEAGAGLPLVVIGEARDGAQVIQSVRAGALDFIDREDDPVRLRDQIVRRMSALPAQPRGEAGDFSVVMAAQPGGGAGAFALNLAVLKSRAAGEGLLIDCTLPASEAGAALGLNPSYTLWDASRDVERLDRTLLSAAVATHLDSGLRLLPLAARSTDEAALSAESFLETLATIRPMFRMSVLNVGGVRQPQLLAAMLGAATQIYFLCPQSLTAVRDGKDLLAGLPADLDLARRALLVVEDYDPEIALTDAQVRQALGFERSLRLPQARTELLNSLNLGRPLVIDGPAGPYVQAVMQAAGATGGVAADGGGQAASGWTRLRDRMSRALGGGR
jgi:pilus assembly protein CpaE